MVTVSSSTIQADSEPPAAILGRDLVYYLVFVCFNSKIRCVTDAQEGSWFMVKLEYHKLIPKNYTWRHYKSWV